MLRMLCCTHVLILHLHLLNSSKSWFSYHIDRKPNFQSPSKMRDKIVELMDEFFANQD